MESVGCWDCKYHPGKFNYLDLTYDCCGETFKEPAFHYGAFGHYTTWKPKDQWNHIPALSEGCCRRDCIPKAKCLIPEEDIPVEDIATLVPFMERKVHYRLGLKKNPLRLVRQEERPYCLWKKAPKS